MRVKVNDCVSLHGDPLGPGGCQDVFQRVVVVLLHKDGEVAVAGADMTGGHHRRE